MSQRLRVGVVGTGIIAQVMHLNYLRELSDRYEIVALCDISLDNATACAEQYGVSAVFTDWREMLRQPMDAVFVLTSGSHAPIAIAAANAGLHVLVEKPMCFSVAEGKQMVAAAEQAGVKLMVAYPKRYDAAVMRFSDEVNQLSDARLLRVTTLEAPFLPYIGHYALAPVVAPPLDVLERLRAETTESVDEAIGSVDDVPRSMYHAILLDCLVHELNTIRRVLGEPESLDYVDLRGNSLTVMLTCSGVPVSLNWIDLPGFTRYSMEFAMYTPERRLTLSFPSPFLRNEPTLLTVEAGEPGTTRSWKTEELSSYENAFKQELVAFHDCVVMGTEPQTSGLDGLRDIALCEAIVRSARQHAPVAHPTRIR